MSQITTASGRVIEIQVYGGILRFCFEVPFPGEEPHSYTFFGSVRGHGGRLDRRRLTMDAFRRSDASGEYSDFGPATRDRWPDIWREIDDEILPAIRELLRSAEFAAHREAWLSKRRADAIKSKEEEIARCEARLAVARKELAQRRAASA